MKSQMEQLKHFFSINGRKCNVREASEDQRKYGASYILEASVEGTVGDWLYFFDVFGQYVGSYVDGYFVTGEYPKSSAQAS